MLTTLLSFFGGTAFRMLFGEISAMWNKAQDHKHEIEMLKLQSELDDKAHQRTLEAQKAQAEHGIKTAGVEIDRDRLQLDEAVAEVEAGMQLIEAEKPEPKEKEDD